MLRWLWIIVALVAWSAGSWVIVFAFAGTGPCALLHRVPNNAPGATPFPIDFAAREAACSQPDIGSILISVVGYTVIIALAIATRPRPRGTTLQAERPTVEERRRRLNERLRAEYIAGAEEEWRRADGALDDGRGLERAWRRWPDRLRDVVDGALATRPLAHIPSSSERPPGACKRARLFRASAG